MKQNLLVSRWNAAFAAAGAVVAVVAALLLAIIGVARSISSNAQRILRAAQAIHDNTCPVWQLADTNAVAADLLAEVQGIAQNAAQVADALERGK